MRKILPVLVIFAIVGLIGVYFAQNRVTNMPEQQPVTVAPKQEIIATGVQDSEIKAAFAIFTNGTFRIFTAAMYHNLSPDAFITAENPNIITVTKKGITWQEFFDTLPFELTKECLTTGTKQTFCTNSSGVLKFYLNGAPDDDMLVRVINDLDKALITFGPEGEPNLDFQLSQIPNPSD